MKIILTLIKKLELLNSLAVRLTVLTRKSNYPIHPKHLVRLGSLWFEKYLKSSDVVLDLGCDNGMHTLKAARKVKKVYGIEYQAKSIQIARNLATNLRVNNTEFIESSLEDKLNFPGDKFDKVLFLDVLEHLNKRTQIMKECYRILKKSGMLFLSIPNSETSWKRLLRKNGLNSFADPDHKTEYTEKDAIRTCTEVGFKILRVDPITLDTPLAPFISLVGGISLSLYRRLLDWKKNKMHEHSEETVGFRIIAQKI